MTTSSTDTSATKPSGRRWLRWDALKRQSKRWISLQVNTTFTTPPVLKLTSTVAIGEFTQTWYTSKGTNKVPIWIQKCVVDNEPLQASGGREETCNMVTKLLLVLLALACKLVGVWFLSTLLKNCMTTDSTGQPVPWWFDRVSTCREFRILIVKNRLQLTENVNIVHFVFHIHENLLTDNGLLRVFSRTIDIFETIVTNCMNITMHIDVNTAQFEHAAHRLQMHCTHVFTL